VRFSPGRTGLSACDPLDAVSGTLMTPSPVSSAVIRITSTLF